MLRGVHSLRAHTGAITALQRESSSGGCRFSLSFSPTLSPPPPFIWSCRLARSKQPQRLCQTTTAKQASLLRSALLLRRTLSYAPLGSEEASKERLNKTKKACTGQRERNSRSFRGWQDGEKAGEGARTAFCTFRHCRASRLSKRRCITYAA